MNGIKISLIGMLFSIVLIVIPISASAFMCTSNPCFGTAQNDKIGGTVIDNIIFGKGGHDEIGGSSGDDKLYGGDGDDVLVGNTGDDDLFGAAGNDLVEGSSGEDRISGGNGDDSLRGNSLNFLSDGAPDQIKCGPGNDVVYLDPSEGDTTSNDCETKITS